MTTIRTGVLFAGLSAVSFGLTTPLVARFAARVQPLSAAALLYAGAALFSLLFAQLGRKNGRPLGISALPRLFAIALLGAALAPTAFVWGLARTSALSAALALNFEAVFTAALAYLAFRETLGARVIGAIFVMVLGGALLALDGAVMAKGELLGLGAVLLATLAWAADNTLTRPLADADPSAVVAAKGALGAASTLLAALALGERRPSLTAALALLACGASGYGLSLRLYLLAQRRIGAARTSSLFACAPFVGAVAALAFGARGFGPLTAAAALAFALGVYLHASERHAHAHVHEAIEHEHAHRHDDCHHEHEHDPPVLGEHTHRHRHARFTHEHEHAPDLHHAHEHHAHPDEVSQRESAGRAPHEHE